LLSSPQQQHKRSGAMSRVSSSVANSRVGQAGVILGLLVALASWVVWAHTDRSTDHG
jgi:hypothetical protein